MRRKPLPAPLTERVRAVLFNRRVVFGIPFLWLLLFFLLPFALVLKISLTSAVMATLARPSERTTTRGRKLRSLIFSVSRVSRAR